MLTYKDILDFVKNGNNTPSSRVIKTDEEWKRLLTDEQFRVTRQQGTEAIRSSKLCTLYEPAIYQCVCCRTDLFDSKTKYESHSGWPAFTEPITDNVISYYADTSFGMSRIAVHCSVCDAHLGHVFPDDQTSTGLWFCINGVSLNKK